MDINKKKEGGKFKISFSFCLLFLACFYFCISSNSFGFSYKETHEFEIYRNAKKIGFHKLSFKKQDNQIIVNSQIRMTVKFGFPTIFKYMHDGEETWNENNFIKANTITQKNNRNFKFSANRLSHSSSVVENNGVG